MSPEELDIALQKLRSFEAWAAAPETEALLTTLHLERSQAALAVLDAPDESRNMEFFKILREQLIGEARGLDRARVWIESTREELASKTKPD